MGGLDMVGVNSVDGQVPSVEGLDLDAIFANDDSEAGVEDASFVCDKPHWKVSREEIRRVLQVIQSFPARSVVFMAVWKSGGKLNIHANNRDAFIDSCLPILNEGSYDSGDKVYFLDSQKLLAFVAAYKQFVFSFDDKGDIYYESPYSLYKLENLSIKLDDIRIQADREYADQDWVPFPLTKAEVGVLRTLYGFAVKISDSKVLITADKVESFFTLYKYSVVGQTKVNENVVVRRLDLSTIHEISNGDLWFSYTGQRLYFKFELGIVSFLRVPYDEASFMYPDSFAQGPEVGRFVIDIPLIRQALKLTNLLNADTVKFRQEGEGVLMVASDQAKFTVGRGSVSEEFLISTELFSRVLATVDVGEMTLEAVVTEQGMDLILDRAPVRKVYSLTRTSVSQFKRDLKAEMRLGQQEDRVEKRKEAGTFSELVGPPSNKSMADLFKDGELFGDGDDEGV
jgi:hypothetical protein